jgi:hypothetical protein
LIDTIEEQCGGLVGFRPEIVAMPEGTDDPDNFIRSPEGGIDAFKALPRMSQTQGGFNNESHRIYERTADLRSR